MDKTTLILGLAGLLVLFTVLVSIYVWIGRSKTHAEPSSQAVITFEGMCALIHSRSTSNLQLNTAVDTIIERYGHIEDFRVYASLLEALCVHPKTDSKVILRFQKALITANPKYKEQIEKTLKLGLAARK
ncbi:MAG: hypothetical protein Q8S36_08550 [Sulfuricurvum sp.]|nr:hypothetical protein [Sulfuricurvum sp.]